MKENHTSQKRFTRGVDCNGMADAREYHERTKHTPQQFREMDFELDFDNQPRPSKVYADLSRRSLGAVVDPPETPALATVEIGRAHV